jgi:uncharacterized membrane protein YciS (DUF1049 family)
MGRIQRAMCAGMLMLQAVVVFLTTPVLLVLTDVDTVIGLLLGLGLALACIVAAGTMGRSFGGRLGWAVQVASILMGFLVTAMFALGLVFGSLYAGSWFLGAKIDRERLERGQTS